MAVSNKLVHAAQIVQEMKSGIAIGTLGQLEECCRMAGSPVGISHPEEEAKLRSWMEEIVDNHSGGMWKRKERKEHGWKSLGEVKKHDMNTKVPLHKCLG